MIYKRALYHTLCIERIPIAIQDLLHSSDNFTYCVFVINLSNAHTDAPAHSILQ